MKSRTFQIGVRFTAAVLVAATYIMLIRYTTYKLVLGDSYRWGYIDGWRQEPTLYYINTDLTSWILGATIGSIVFAAIVAFIVLAFRWIKKQP
jgi:hypothetical protein